MNPQKNEQKDEAINQLNRGDQGIAKSLHPLFTIQFERRFSKQRHMGQVSRSSL